METLHRTVVAAEEIDHLGHMNVFFYGVHARHGADRLLADVGLVDGGGQAVVLVDTYVRHHREQREGAPLEVRGGVLDVSADGIRLYEELAHASTGELAASFVLAFGAFAPGGEERRPLGDVVVAAAEARCVEVPEHGRWRSISPDEDVIGTAPSFAVVQERDLAHREVRTIGAEEADGDGVVSLSIAELVWGGQPKPGRGFQPLHELADGRQMGFATLETRASWAHRSKVGDRLQSFSAEVDHNTKTMLTKNWVFDVDTGTLVAAFSVVNVAFDTTSRRAIPVPDEIRRRWAVRFHPDLA